jgi:hypothetical protein
VNHPPRVLRVCWVVVLVIALHSGLAARAELVIVTCESDKPCAYRQGFAATIDNKPTILLAASSTSQVRESTKVKIDGISGLYRNPTSGALEVRSLAGKPEGIALPTTVDKNKPLDPAGAWTGRHIVYAPDERQKLHYALPAEQLVAIFNTDNLAGGAVAFVRSEVQSNRLLPRTLQLIAGLVQTFNDAPALQLWRNEVRTAMTTSLDTFRRQTGNPQLLEQTLNDGLRDMDLYRRITTSNGPPDPMLDSLQAERLLLTERVGIASVLQKAQLPDSYIDKLDQLGLASWSRPELRTELKNALVLSAETHEQAGKDLWERKQFRRALDEARLAAERLPCRKDLRDNYYLLRSEFVQRTAIPIAKPYNGTNKNRLDQIVLELSAVKDDVAMPPERVEYFRNRLKDGLQLDDAYIPLLLRQASFHKNIGELSIARDIVIRVQTSFPLDQSQTKEWLKMDADLNIMLATSNDIAEKRSADHLRNESFRDVLLDTEVGLKADPKNVTLWYRRAVAAWFLQDYAAAKTFAAQYLLRTNPACPETDRSHVFELFRDGSIDQQPTAPTAIPHWISGAPYTPGTAYYDPNSGGFIPQVQSATTKMSTATTFLWDGYMAVSITTSESLRTTQTPGAIQPLVPIFVAEPEYDRQHFHMMAIGSKAGTNKSNNSIPLQYANHLDFDIRQLERFNDTGLPLATAKSQTRGWAGNPYFHPFIWTGIYIFDLQYDLQGRISTATPATIDPSRPSFGEPLTFTWQDKTNRLLSIKGQKYARTMEYDEHGRLIKENITLTNSTKTPYKGTITYHYVGNTNQLRTAVAEDNFLDHTQRSILFRATNN